MIQIPSLERRSPGAILVISLALTGLLSVGDYLTGPEISFSIFYVLPIAVAAWYGSRTVGILIAVVVAATLNIVEVMSGVVYSHPLIVYWNSIASLGASAKRAAARRHRFPDGNVQSAPFLPARRE
jgi:hypothetical protein